MHEMIIVTLLLPWTIDACWCMHLVSDQYAELAAIANVATHNAHKKCLQHVHS